VYFREQMKLKRMNGKSYVGYNRQGNKVFQNIERESRSIKAACTSLKCLKSKVRYCNIFSENERLKMFEHFWQCNWDEKKTFCINMINKKEAKRLTTIFGTESQRHFSYTYHLKSNENKYPVCKVMFLNTFALKEWMVRNWLDSSFNGLPNIKNCRKIPIEVDIIDDPQLEEVSPRRSVQFRQDHLVQWFDSLAKMPSHYCRKKTNRLYLEGPFNTKQEVYTAYQLK